MKRLWRILWTDNFRLYFISPVNFRAFKLGWVFFFKQIIIPNDSIYYANTMRGETYYDEKTMSIQSRIVAEDKESEFQRQAKEILLEGIDTIIKQLHKSESEKCEAIVNKLKEEYENDRVAAQGYWVGKELWWRFCNGIIFYEISDGEMRRILSKGGKPLYGTMTHQDSINFWRIHTKPKND